MADEAVGPEVTSSGSVFWVVGIPQLRPRWTRAEIASAIPDANTTTPITPRTTLWTPRLPPRKTRRRRTIERADRRRVADVPAEDQERPEKESGLSCRGGSH